MYKILQNKEKLGKKSFEKIVNWVVLHALNLSTQEEEAGDPGLLSEFQTPGLYSETLS